MTYGVGVLVRDGLLLMADTRTNAGLDNIATFRKLHLFESGSEKMMALATAGNLAISQAVVSLLREGLKNPETNRNETLLDQPTLFKAAQFIGRVVREVHETDGPALERAGNSFEATADTPYLQIGEHKYGKPIMDRAVSFQTDLYDCLKLALISMDSTMRSNLGVGLPIDFVLLRAGAEGWEVNRRIEAGEPYFHDLRERWSAALRKAHSDIPTPPYRAK